MDYCVCVSKAYCHGKLLSITRTWWSRSLYVINYLQYQDEMKDYFNLNIKLFNACVGKELDSKVITIANQIVYF